MKRVSLLTGNDGLDPHHQNRYDIYDAVQKLTDLAKDKIMGEYKTFGIEDIEFIDDKQKAIDKESPYTILYKYAFVAWFSKKDIEANEKVTEMLEYIRKVTRILPARVCLNCTSSVDIELSLYPARWIYVDEVTYSEIYVEYLRCYKKTPHRLTDICLEKVAMNKIPLPELRDRKEHTIMCRAIRRVNSVPEIQ